MAIEVKRPQRLNIEDMPRDPSGSLGGLRSSLVAVFNYCRQYPTKMATLRTVLKFAYNKVVEWEKGEAAYQEAVTKSTLELQGRALGIELDRRLTVDKLEEQLSTFIAKSEEDKAKELEEQAVATEALKEKADALELAKKVEAAKAFIANNSVPVTK